MSPSSGDGYAVQKKKIDVLGSVIKSARINKHITRGELSKTLGITPRYLAGIENENRKPSFDVLARIIHELEISPDAIFPSDY